MKDWASRVNFAVTLCNTKGEIVYMNEMAKATFEKYGNGLLEGKSLFDCHPPQANEKIKEMLRDKTDNIYSIEKNGRKKVIYQCPWFEDDVFMGLAEISMVLPENMPHFIRKS